METQPGHDRLRGVPGVADEHRCHSAPRRHQTARRPWWPARRLARRLGDPEDQAGLRGRAVAHRQPDERPRGADLVLRPELRALQPLLLRPDGPGPAARPGVHPARGADRHQPGPWAAAGPGPTLDEISRSALPSRTDLDLSVVVTESGIAEVPLSREVLRASPSELSRAIDQLAWTLRQVPGIERVRMTVAGAPVSLPGGRADAPVTTGSEFDAGGTSDEELWGLRGGRVVDLSSNAATSVDGTLGRPGYSMRSFAVSESRGHRRGLRQRQDRLRLTSRGRGRR